MGALEADVLDVLWRSDQPMTPAAVLDRLDGDLAYTTVMTILTRLHKKGLVDRSRAGRAYEYVPRVSEADLAASRMRTALTGTSDRFATINRFVDTLSKKDAAALRAVIEAMDE
jgi:predicted transcriptional regulator